MIRVPSHLHVRSIRFIKIALVTLIYFPPFASFSAPENHCTPNEGNEKKLTDTSRFVIEASTTCYESVGMYYFRCHGQENDIDRKPHDEKMRLNIQRFRGVGWST